MESRQLAGRYELLEQIGTGSTGSVFRGRDRVSGQEVAVKVNQGEEALSSIAHEFSLLHQLHHPFLPKVFEYGQEPGSAMAFFAMESVHGKPLSRALPRLSTSEAASLLHQSCHVLGYLHRRGLVHADLKPDHLLVTLENGSPEIRLIDLGLTHGLSDRKIGVVRGTLRYAAEPIRRGRPGTPRTDLFALGASFIEALEGSTSEALTWAQRAARMESPLGRFLGKLVSEANPPSFSCAEDAAHDLVRDEPMLAGAEIPWGEPALHGHADSRQWLVEWSESAWQRSARARLVIVEGEAGIGKSRVLQEVAGQWMLAGAALTHTACREVSAGIDRPLSRILTQLAAGIGSEDSTLATELEAQSHSRVEPEEADLTGEARSALLTLHHGRVLELLIRASAERPVLVLLEDFQFADPSTIAFLERVCRERWKGNVWFLAALRAGKPTGERSEALTELQSLPRSHTLSLERLDAEDSRALLQSCLGETTNLSLLRPLAEQTGGHPGFCSSVARVFLTETRGSRPQTLAELIDAGLPSTVSEAIDQELARLEPGEREWLERFSILSRPAPWRLLQGWIGVEPSRDRVTLAKLVRKGVLRRESDPAGPQYEIRSDVMRRAVRRSLPPATAKRLHGAAADAWRSVLGDTALAHAGLMTQHLLRAGRPREAAEFGPAAVRELLTSQSLAAAKELGEELCQIEKLGNARRGELLELLADAHFRTGSLAEARERLEQSVAAEKQRERPSPRLLARRYRKSARSAYLQGDFETTRRAVNQVLKAAGETPSCARDAARAYRLLALIEFKIGSMGEARLLLERGLACLAKPEEDLAAATLWNALGVMALTASNFEEAEQYHQRALRIREHHGDIEGRTRSLGNLAAVSLATGDYRAAQTLYSESIRESEKIGNRQLCASLLAALGRLDHCRARFPAANQRYGRVLSLAQETGWVEGEIDAHVSLAWNQYEKGHYVSAKDGVQTARKLAADHGIQGSVCSDALLVQAMVELCMGQYEAAETSVRSGLQLAEKNGWVLVSGLLRKVRAQVLGDRGFEQRAREEVRESVRLLREGRDRYWLAEGLVTAAELLPPSPTEDYAKEAGTVLAGLDAPAVKARLQLQWATRHFSRGDSVGALEHARRALKVAEELELPELQWRSYASLGWIHRAAGRADRSVLWLRQAVEVFRDVIGRAEDPSVAEDYLGVPLRQRVLTSVRQLLLEESRRGRSAHP